MRLHAEKDEHRAALAIYAELDEALRAERGARPSAATQDLARELERLAIRRPGTTAALHVTRRPVRRSPAAPPPSGTVTFVAVRAEDAPADVRPELTALNEGPRRHGGVNIDLAGGSSYLAAFAHASDALDWAAACQIRAAPPRAAMAVHTTEVAPIADGTYPRSTTEHVLLLLAAAHPTQILYSETAASVIRYGLNGGLRLRDLGSYRLAGTDTSERLFQLDYPGGPDALAPLGAESAYKSRLPLRLTRFFGRQGEMAELQALLAGEARLVTLVGGPGCGKTRLALEVAYRAQETFAGRVWFVPLADVREERVILDHALDFLGIARSPETPPLEQIAAALGDEAALILFDNCEHLQAPAVELSALRERLPAVRCLATSRRRLELSGERTFAVGPLPTPPAALQEDLLANESVQLFVDRARDAQPDFRLSAGNSGAVVELCRRLEGVPLALELAAARVNVLAPAQILERIWKLDVLASRSHEGDDRHHSLRAALDWSYCLLSPELQRFFDRLSVFRGGWTVEAAEAVCEEPLASDYLVQLAELSLIQPDPNVRTEPRYRMLEMLRQYAASRLEASGAQKTIRDSHFRYFRALSERFYSNHLGPDAKLWLDIIDEDRENLLAALDCYENAPDDIERAMNMAKFLFAYSWQRGYLSLWSAVLDRMLTADSERRPTTARGWILTQAAQLAHSRDMDCARSLYSEALTIARLLKVGRLEAAALVGLGIVAYHHGDYAAAKQFFAEAGELYRMLGEEGEALRPLFQLGIIAYDQGDYDSAWKIFSENLEALRKGGARWTLPGAMMNLGNVAIKKGDYSTASSLYQEALAISREIDMPENSAHCLGLLGMVDNQLGDTALAISRTSEALEIAHKIDAKELIAFSNLNLGYLYQLTGDTERARSHLAASLRLGPHVMRKRLIPAALEYAGRLAAAEADRPSCSKSLEIREHAIRLFAADQGIRDSIGVPPEEPWVPEYVRLLRGAVDQQTFERAWAEGLAMTHDEAISYTLAFLDGLKLADLTTEGAEQPQPGQEFPQAAE